MITTKIEILRVLPDGSSRIIGKMEHQDADYSVKYETRVTVTPPQEVEAK